jgi:hypothetical protein
MTRMVTGTRDTANSTSQVLTLLALLALLVQKDLLSSTKLRPLLVHLLYWYKRHEGHGEFDCADPHFTYFTRT